MTIDDYITHCICRGMRVGFVINQTVSIVHCVPKTFHFVIFHIFAKY